MADDNDEPMKQRRPGRRVVRNQPADSAPEAADANTLFRKLIANATANEVQAETMWIPDDDEGFVICSVKSREQDKITFETDSGQVLFAFFQFLKIVC